MSMPASTSAGRNVLLVGQWFTVVRLSFWLNRVTFRRANFARVAFDMRAGDDRLDLDLSARMRPTFLPAVLGAGDDTGTLLGHP
jgi:hypothetical protein